MENASTFHLRYRWLLSFAPRYLADDQMVIKTEALLYDLVAKWFAHDQQTRVEQVGEALSCIRFALFSDAQLKQLQQHWLTTRYPQALTYVKDGVAYHEACKTGHPAINQACKVRALSASLTMVHQGSSYRPFEICAYNAKDGKFYQLFDDSDSARDCRVVTVDNFVYVYKAVDVGGGTLFNAMVRFDPRHMCVESMTACNNLRLDPAFVARGQWLYMFGGNTDQFALLDSVECYNVQTNSWMDLLPLPQPVSAHAATVHKDLIYLSGGVDVQRQPVPSLHMYDPTSQQWHSKAPMHCARRLHVMVSLSDKVYVLGGIGSHSFHQQTQIPVESYDPLTDQWTVFSSTLAGRSVGHFITLNDKILSIGREHYEATEDEIWEYKPSEDTWSALVKVPRRVSLATASAVLLNLNFSDDKIAKKVLSDRR